MRKLLFICLAIVLGIGLIAQPALAKKPDTVVKVQVCHVIAANDVIPFFDVYLLFGKELTVSEDALETHLMHGDFDNFWGGEEAEGPINAFREAGAHLPAANCYFGMRENGEFYGPLQ